MERKRWELFSLMKPEINHFSFVFRFGNDEYGISKRQRRTAHYQLFLVMSNGSILVASGRTRKDVHQLGVDLENKYTSWVNLYIKKHGKKT